MLQISGEGSHLQAIAADTGGPARGAAAGGEPASKASEVPGAGYVERKRDPAPLGGSRITKFWGEGTD